MCVCLCVRCNGKSVCVPASSRMRRTGGCFGCGQGGAAEADGSTERGSVTVWMCV